MRRIKQFIKKVLIRLHILKRPEVSSQPVKKVVPDFDIISREKPVVVLNKGAYVADLDNQEKPQIAIQIHAFFLEVMDEIVEILNAVPYPFDCYISTDTEQKKNAIEVLLKEKCQIHYLQVDVMDNRGRDVGPFLQQLGPVIENYKYFAHLHTKKSKHTDFGDDWRLFLYRNMFGGSEVMRAILEKFEQDEQLGLVIPEVYPIVRELLAWDNTKNDVQKLLNRMGLTAELSETPICPVGDIFWARTEAVKKLFDMNFKQTDFQEEAGQLNYTLAHVIERIWCYLVQAQGYRYEVCINGMGNTEELNVKRSAIYACSEEVTDDDVKSIEKISQSFDTLYLVVSNDEAKKKVSSISEHIIMAETKDCGKMWETALESKQESLQQADELALINNAGIGPLFDLKQIMNTMSARKVENWSVFKTNLSKTVFSVFDVKKTGYNAIREMAANDVVLETVYVNESAYIGEWLFTEEPISELAFDYIILHSPFITKTSMNCKRKNENVLLKEFFEAANIAE